MFLTPQKGHLGMPECWDAGNSVSIHLVISDPPVGSLASPFSLHVHHALEISTVSLELRVVSLSKIRPEIPTFLTL